jgi:hypothetical protein
MAIEKLCILRHGLYEAETQRLIPEGIPYVRESGKLIEKLLNPENPWNIAFLAGMHLRCIETTQIVMNEFKSWDNFGIYALPLFNPSREGDFEGSLKQAYEYIQKQLLGSVKSVFLSTSLHSVNGLTRIILKESGMEYESIIKKDENPLRYAEGYFIDLKTKEAKFISSNTRQ